MAINKVVYGGNTLIDLTGDSVTAAALYSGAKAHDKSGEQIVGTNPYNAANVDPAVANILAALTEKGVDTSGAGLGDIAALVAGIEAGGGGLALYHETITYEEDYKPTIAPKHTHNLGVIPNFAYVFADEFDTSITGDRYFHSCLLFARDVNDGTKNNSVIRSFSSTTTTSLSNAGGNNGGYALAGNKGGSNCIANNANEETISLWPRTGSNLLVCQAGKTYHIYIGRIDL